MLENLARDCSPPFSVRHKKRNLTCCVAIDSGLNLCAEMLLHNKARMHCLAVDLNMLYNTADRIVAGQAVMYMGLSKEANELLTDPLVS